MSVFKDLVSIWKSEDSLSQAWAASNEMLSFSHEMFTDSISALRSGEKNKVIKSIKHIWDGEVKLFTIVEEEMWEI